MSVEVVPVRSRSDRRAFVECPYLLYARQPLWVPPLRRDEHRRLMPAHNPFFEHGSIELWLARSNRRIVGRVAAIHDRLHDAAHGEAVTWFGFFEAEDAVVARALLGVVEEHARARQRLVVRGPANPSLNESAGLLVDGFDAAPYVLMPYNPPSYVQFVESQGYVKAKDLLAWDIDLTRPLGERIVRLAKRTARHGIVVRTVDLAQFDRDLAILMQLYRAAWSDNWGFVPPTDAEIRQLAIDFRPVIEKEIVLFAEIDGRAVGCAIALPDMNQVLARMDGRLLPFGLWHVLRRRRIVTQARLLLLGVLPEFRKTGLYPLLIADIHRRAVGIGMRRAELSWTLEDNDAVNAGIIAAGGRRYKTYRLYEKHV